MTRRKIAARLRTLGIGALPLLAGLLMASSLIRLGDGTGQAIAQQLGMLAHAEGGIAAESPELDVILAALKEREARMDERAQLLARREAAMAEAEIRIAEQLAQMAAAEAEMDDLIGRADSAADDDLTRLTSVYEAMKPKEAAALFAQMAPQFAAGFLGRMRPDAAADIMAGLDPESAYSISLMLAGRYAGKP